MNCVICKCNLPSVSQFGALIINIVGGRHAVVCLHNFCRCVAIVLQKRKLVITAQSDLYLLHDSPLNQAYYL